MAIAYVAERGNKVESVLSTSMTVTVTANTAVGNRLFLLYGSRGGDGTPSTFTVTDPRGNIWRTDKVFHAVSANDYDAIASTNISTALITNDVVTITFGVALGAGRAVTLQEFSGLREGSYALDQRGSANAGSGTAVSVPTVGATDTAAELVIASLTGDGVTTTWTVGSGYSEFTTKAQSDGIRTHYGEYKIVSATGVQTATATSPAPNDGWTGVVATYRAAMIEPVAWFTA